MPLTAAAAGVGFCILCDRKRYDLEDGLCGRCRPWTRRKDPPLPPRPTHYLPGTPEKVEVMRDRDNRGYQVCHPDDATIEVDDSGLLRVAGGIQSGIIREPRICRAVAG